MPPARPTRRGLLGGWLGAGSLGLLAGCGAQPPQSPPSGVDGLDVPTPSPDPRDFVRGVDHRLMPLVPGRQWEYAVTGGPAATRTAVVLRDPLPVAGIDTTAVRTTDRDAQGRVVDTWEDGFAQDRAGNVWWLARLGDDGWRAGRRAQAGLVMPATPRLGDGFVTADVRGAVLAVATVADLDASAVTAYRQVTGGLRLEVREPGAGRTTELVYAAGTGLVESQQVEGGAERAALTDVRG